MNMNKFMAFLPVFLLVSTQLAAAPPENPPPIEIDAFVVNDEANPVTVVIQGQEANPVPVTVQKSAKEIVWADKLLIVENDIRTFNWRLMNDDIFMTVPEGYMLAVTDILVSRWLFSDAGRFTAAFWKQKDGSSSRLFDIGGTVTPFSHSFTTPFFVQAGHDFAVDIQGEPTGGTQLKIMVTGYLTPVAE